MNHHSHIRKDQRVIGACIQFTINHLFDVPKGFLECSEYLSGAAKGVWVLDFCAGIHRLRKRAPLVLIDATRKIRMRPERIGDTLGHEGLATETSSLMSLPTERLWLTVQDLKQTGSEEFHPTQQLHCLM